MTGRIRTTLLVAGGVDERGLTVHSPLGWPTHTVPLAEAAAVLTALTARARG